MTSPFNPDTEELEHGANTPDFERSLAQKMLDDRAAKRHASLMRKQREIEKTIREIAGNVQQPNKDGTPVSADFRK